jgi:RimJ/RimL family protein N-acetyltransferase
MKAAIDASLEHLRPWMPWAAEEPQELQKKIASIRRFRGKFDLDQDYVYGIFDREETRVLGGAGLHTRVGPAALEIGYWIRGDAINQGYASEASAALTRVAFAVHGVHRMEIHCDPQNVRSAAVPRKLGYTLDDIRRQNLQFGEGGPWRDSMIWTLLEEEYPNTPCAAAEIEAYDAFGRQLRL